MIINGIEYADNQFMECYYKIYGDSAALDDKEAYIQELTEYAKDNMSLEEIITKHGIENGYIA